MKGTQVTLLAAFAGLVAAAPSSTLKRRSETTKRQAGASTCSQFDNVYAGNYAVQADLWGEGTPASNEYQCVTITGSSGNSISWQTSFEWNSPSSQVRSYAHATADNIQNVQLSTISSIPTSWQWSYSTDDIKADVSYDMFTTPTSDGTDQEYEIMIWLAAIGGASPIASYGASGAIPNATDLTFSGNSFNLYQGINSGTGSSVYSFVANEQIPDFTGDVMDFFNYLIDNFGFPNTQYLKTLQAGTEAFDGTATFTTSGWSATLN